MRRNGPKLGCQAEQAHSFQVGAEDRKLAPFGCGNDDGLGRYPTKEIRTMGQVDLALRFQEHHAEALAKSPNPSRPDRGRAKPLLEPRHSYRTHCLMIDAQV